MATGIWRTWRQLDGAGDLLAGNGPRQRSADGKRSRDRTRRPDGDRFWDRSAEGPIPPQDLERRGDLVSGFFRAERRVRFRRTTDRSTPRGQPLRRQRTKGV